MLSEEIGIQQDKNNIFRPPTCQKGKGGQEAKVLKFLDPAEVDVAQEHRRLLWASSSSSFLHVTTLHYRRTWTPSPPGRGEPTWSSLSVQCSRPIADSQRHFQLIAHLSSTDPNNFVYYDPIDRACKEIIWTPGLVWICAFVVPNH